MGFDGYCPGGRTMGGTLTQGTDIASHTCGFSREEYLKS